MHVVVPILAMVKQWEIVRETQSDSAQDTWAIQSSGYHLQALHLLPWKVFPSAVPFLLGREIMICASYTHTNLLETSSEDDVSSGCKLWYLQRLQMFKHPYEVFQLQWEVNFLVLRIQLELGDCWKLMEYWLSQERSHQIWNEYFRFLSSSIKQMKNESQFQ